MNTELSQAMELSARLAIKAERIARIAFDSEDDAIRAAKAALKNERSKLYKMYAQARKANVDISAEIEKQKTAVKRAKTAYAKALRQSESGEIFNELKAAQREHNKARKAVKIARASHKATLPDYAQALELSRLASLRTL